MADSHFNIRDFMHELADIPLSDMLCSLDLEKSKVVALNELPYRKTSFDISGEIRSILKEAQDYNKEADLNSLCAAHLLVEWAIDGKQIQTPLFLFPLEWSVHKQLQQLHILCDETFELNPFVKRMLRIWTNEAVDFEGLNVEDTFEAVKELIQKHKLEVRFNEKTFLGNFHYHRFHILRELEGIDRAERESSLLNRLLGKAEDSVQVLDLPNDILAFADTDQLAVFENFRKENVVVQGPPGTGKSQVLINVLGKLLFSKNRALVVSEKKVALEVLSSKLKDLNLGHCAFVVHSQTRSRDFIEHLKSTWMLLEQDEKAPKPGLRLSNQRFSQLQQLLDRLNSPTLVGGVSYNTFLELIKETPIGDHPFRTDTPDIAEWLKHKNDLRLLDIAVGGLNKLAGFKPSFFQLENGDQRLKLWLEELLFLKKELNVFTFDDLQLLYESLGRCRLLENESYKVYSQLLSSEKEMKKFDRNRLRFTEVHQSLDLKKADVALWKKEPSTTEIESFENAKGYFSKSKIRKTLKSYLSNSAVDLSIAINNWKAISVLKCELNELESYFLKLGLQPNLLELELGMTFLKSIKGESKDRLAEVASWSREKRDSILKVQQLIETLYKDLQRALYIDSTKDLEAEVYSSLQQFEVCFPYTKTIQALPLSISNLFRSTFNWQDLQALILQSNWKKTEALFPELAKFDGDLLKSKIVQCIESEDEDLAEFALELYHQQRLRFKKNQELLLKPSQKCSIEERERRMILKRGKALLVKEFGKSRSHISIRELLDSDARLWIQELLPIWMATPTQVADHFPLKTELFDVVVFDEASQIPLPNAFGAMYRSKRALVAGDEQQMSPTNYFGKRWSGHDLLHQALFYFRKVSLKHHYRSEHPELIAFSNRHFYNNELLVYPSPEQKQVVFSHFVESGKFIDRKNLEEAKELIVALETADWSKRIGIVAFSEEQLKTIWNSCNSSLRERISEGQENNMVFFKALEQVQGDEADLLYVSMAYAKNEENEFHMRFGPLNQANGYKRLNVLLTRATQEFHFFHSVNSADFGISANESVDLLRKYLSDLELQNENSVFSFPHELQPTELNGNQVVFENISSSIPNAIELSTFYRVMEYRGWNVSLIN